MQQVLGYLVLGILLFGSNALSQSQQTLSELLSAYLQSGIASSIQTVDLLGQDSSSYDLEQSFNLVYDVQMSANASVVSFDYAIEALVQLASNVPEDSPDYYALSQLYDLATSGSEAFSAIYQWFEAIETALLSQNDAELEELGDYYSYIEPQLMLYAENLLSLIDAYDEADYGDANSGITALEYLQDQPEEAYASNETYELMSDLSAWGHDLSISIIDNFPSGGTSYSCRRGIDPGCY